MRTCFSLEPDEPTSTLKDVLPPASSLIWSFPVARPVMPSRTFRRPEGSEARLTFSLADERRGVGALPAGRGWVARGGAKASGNVRSASAA